MSLIHTFASLPESLKSMAIELALIRARQDQYGNLRIIVEEAVAAAAAAADRDREPRRDPGGPSGHGQDRRGCKRCPAHPRRDPAPSQLRPSGVLPGSPA